MYIGGAIEKEILIVKNFRILPFEHVREHVVDEGLLHAFTPNLPVLKPCNSVGAIVKPFEWKPEFRPWDPNIILDLDWEDGERFVELLAVTHGAPISCLMTIHYYIDRAMYRLLSQPHYHASRHVDPVRAIV